MKKNVQKHLSLLSSFAMRKLAEKDEEIKCLTTDAAEKDKQIKNLQTKVHHLAIGSLLLPPVKFVMHRYSQYGPDKIRWWEDGPTFYTRPMGHKVKIKLYFGFILYVRFQSVEGEFDDQLQWPLLCTLSTQLLDQRGEHHLERKTELQIKRGSYSDVFSSINYVYGDIKYPTKGAQYLKEDRLHFRVDVKPNCDMPCSVVCPNHNIQVIFTIMSPLFIVTCHVL